MLLFRGRTSHGVNNIPRGKINKAQKIRETLETMGQDAAPKDVIAALAAKKIKVSAAQVSNIKTALRGGKSSKRGRKGSNGTVTVDDLMAVKKLIGTMGVEKAQAALAALAKLQ